MRAFGVEVATDLCRRLLDEGVPGMKVGERRRLTIPSAAAYGAQGRPPAIPPDSTLIFDVELMGVE